MKKAAATSTTQQASASNSDPQGQLSLGAIGLNLLDTTWRIAVPVIILASLGIFADKSLGTKPWLTLLGTAGGFGIALVLIKRLLDAVTRKDNS